MVKNINRLIKSITKKEWHFFIAITVLVILLTSLPYVYGWLQAPDGYIYLGLHSLTPGDMHVYFSWMEQAKDGNFLAKDLYTGEEQARVILNGFWVAEGFLAKWTGLSNILIFQLTRIALAVFFMFILYLLAVYFWKDILWRKIFFVFMCFSSGLGFFISLFLPDSNYANGIYNWPLDIWAPESNNFLTIFQSPHLIMATAMLVAILFLGFWAFEKDKLKYSIAAGIIALLLFEFHPFHVPTVFGVLGAYFIFECIKQKKIVASYIKHFLIIFFVSFPSILYYLMLEQYDFVTQIRTWQNVCLSPSWWILLISYGLVLVLAVFGSYGIISRRKFYGMNAFLIIWMALQFLLLYIPIPWQRRLMQGLQIPMIILAVQGLYYLYEYLKKRLSPVKFDFLVNNKYLLIILFIFFATSSNLYNLVRDISIFRKGYEPFYISYERDDGYEWLRQNVAVDEVILADLYDGNIIPGRIGRKVFVGHGVETLFFISKVKEMNWFFSANNFDEKKKYFLEQNSIDFVFFSPGADDLGDFEPSEKEYLKEVYENEEVEIYKVKYLLNL
ncbi:MAG: hypothetical protein ABIJ83_02705 [Patescibacteria group bacterium]